MPRLGTGVANGGDRRSPPEVTIVDPRCQRCVSDEFRRRGLPHPSHVHIGPGDRDQAKQIVCGEIRFGPAGIRFDGAVGSVDDLPTRPVDLISMNVVSLGEPIGERHRDFPLVQGEMDAQSRERQVPKGGAEMH